MSVEVTKIKVQAYDLDHLDIFWELNSFDDARIEEYDFYIERSVDGMGGPYKTLAGPFYNTYRFRDPEVNRLHKWRAYFYRIKTVHRPTGREEIYGPEWLRAQPDLVALEIARREHLLLREWAGRLVFHYPRLTFGQRCKSCWDEGIRGNYLGRQVQQNCASCFDTAFVGGYAKPLAIGMQIDPNPKVLQRTDLKEHQFKLTSARTIMYPPLKPGDMIIEAENKRWNIEKITPTEKLRATVRQEVDLWAIPTDDVRYALPVNFDQLRQHAPSRSFTRPHSLQPEQINEVDDLLKGKQFV